MTKDLALLVRGKQEWVNTQDYLDAVKVRLEKALGA